MLNFVRRLLGIHKPEAHVHARELGGLVASVVAWRRGGLEQALRDGVAVVDLEQDRNSLAWYAEGAGIQDPLVAELLAIPVGELDTELFLLASYRIEAAGGIAWALGLIETLPPPEQRIGLHDVVTLFPLQGEPSPAIDHAKRRPDAELEAKLADLIPVLDRPVDPGDEAANIAFSRAFERVRALQWVQSGAPFLDDVDPLREPASR